MMARAHDGARWRARARRPRRPRARTPYRSRSVRCDGRASVRLLLLTRGPANSRADLRERIWGGRGAGLAAVPAAWVGSHSRSPLSADHVAMRSLRSLHIAFFHGCATSRRCFGVVHRRSGIPHRPGVRRVSCDPIAFHCSLHRLRFHAKRQHRGFQR